MCLECESLWLLQDGCWSHNGEATWRWTRMTAGWSPARVRLAEPRVPSLSLALLGYGDDGRERYAIVESGEKVSELMLEPGGAIALYSHDGDMRVQIR